MSIKGFIGGIEVSWCKDKEEWIYMDGQVVTTNTRMERECPMCNKLPYLCMECYDIHDACIGHIKYAKSVCCGHGVQKGYIVWCAPPKP